MKRVLVAGFILLAGCGVAPEKNLKIHKWGKTCKGNSWIVSGKELPLTIYQKEKDLCLRKIDVFKVRQSQYHVSSLHQGECSTNVYVPSSDLKMGLYIKCEDY